MSDFDYLQLGYVLVRIKEKRRRKLRAELRKVLEDGKMTPAHAARLRGKLYFSTCSSFFGVGRAALQAFTARQYNKHGTSRLVPSEQNIADLPSRRSWGELHRVIDSVSGGLWTCFRYDVVIPSYESWLSPLKGHVSSKRRRHGSRGAKRAGRARVV